MMMMMLYLDQLYETLVFGKVGRDKIILLRDLSSFDIMLLHLKLQTCFVSRVMDQSINIK